MFKKLTFSKTTVVTVTIALVCIAQDINSRFISIHEKATTQKIRGVGNSLLLPNTHPQMLLQIQNKYLSFRESKQPQKEMVKSGMSEQEQSAQSGELQTVFIGNYILSLKAVLNTVTGQTVKKSVLVAVSQVDSGETSIEKFEDNSNVYGYHLQVLSNRQVELTKENNNQQQKIVLIMFKPRTKK